MEDLADIFPCLQIHPHPIRIPNPFENPSIEDNIDWLHRAGYNGGCGFMRWFGFKENEKKAAFKLIESFKTYPTRQHPNWLNLATDKPPNDRVSEIDWLVMAGYVNVSGFMKFYDLESEAVARKLLARFREKHQQILDGAAQHLKDYELPKIQQRELLDVSPLWDGFDEDGYRIKGKRMTAAQIEQAVILHERHRHLGYRDLKDLAKNGIIHGLPEFLVDMEVDYIPVCEHCTKVLGIMDR